jgi:hypothetical protein
MNSHAVRRQVPSLVSSVPRVGAGRLRWTGVNGGLPRLDCPCRGPGALAGFREAHNEHI